MVKNSPTSAGDVKRHGFHPWVRKIPLRREWQPTPVFLLEESHGQEPGGLHTVHRVAKSGTWLTTEHICRKAEPQADNNGHSRGHTEVKWVLLGVELTSYLFFSS